jgi:hypothetical protein
LHLTPRVGDGMPAHTGAPPRQEDFLLGDLCGVRYRSETQEKFSYIAPQPGYDALLPECSVKYPLALDEGQMVVAAMPGAQIMGKIILPYSDPGDIDHFSSIHSNPPGIITDHPALVFHSYGKGKVIYSTASLESAEFSRPIFINLLKQLQLPFSFEADAPGCVEVTLFHQADKRRYIISLLNFQKDLPNLPVDGIKVRLRLSGKTPEKLYLCPEEKILPYTYADEIEFAAPRLETFQMFSLEYTGISDQ